MAQKPIQPAIGDRCKTLRFTRRYNVLSELVLREDRLRFGNRHGFTRGYLTANLHAIPVVREFLAAIQAHYISSVSRGAGGRECCVLPPWREGEGGSLMRTTEQRIKK